jgi:group II intron reverse transcriptase/maturase
MKSKEEPSLASWRGNPSSPAPRHNPASPREETTGSLSRPGRTAAAPSEKPALSLFPESLMEAVVDPANLRRAWKQVRANHGAPGPDGITLAVFPEWLRPRWPTIRQQLLEGTYRPEPVRRKTLRKPDGGERLLGIPNVLDRLIQQAILQVLTPVFDPTFSDSSHGFRPGRSAHGAARQVQRTIRRGYRFVVDMDLSKFFDRVQHDVLLARVARKVRDPRLLRLIGRYLRAGVMVEGVLQASEEGTPQGGPASPFLANILLDDLDQELERRGLPFVRYADDFVIFTRSRRAAERVFRSVSRYLTRHLRLLARTAFVTRVPSMHRRSSRGDWATPDSPTSVTCVYARSKATNRGSVSTSRQSASPTFVPCKSTTLRQRSLRTSLRSSSSTSVSFRACFGIASSVGSEVDCDGKRSSAFGQADLTGAHVGGVRRCVPGDSRAHGPCPCSRLDYKASSNCGPMGVRVSRLSMS